SLDISGLLQTVAQTLHLRNISSDHENRHAIYLLLLCLEKKRRRQNHGGERDSKDFFTHCPLRSPIKIGNPKFLPVAYCLASIAYLITLSARYSTACGIVTPICFAVLRLMTNSNFVGCSTGSSAGLAPFSILSTYVAARRKTSRSLVE